MRLALLFFGQAVIISVSGAFPFQQTGASPIINSRLFGTKIRPTPKRACATPFRVRGGGAVQPSLRSSADDTTSTEALTTSGGAAETPEDSILDFVAVDVALATNEVAKNWGFILGDGVVKTIGGILALSLPLFANEVAYASLTVTLFFVACFNIAGLFSAPKGFRLRSFAVGVVEMFLANRMRTKPFESLINLTTIIAATGMAQGIVQGVVALGNPDMPGRGSLIFGGLVDVLAGAFVAATLPESSLFVLGTLLGARMLSAGISCIAIGLKGRDVANASLP